MQLNHTIVYCRDKAISAPWWSHVLGLADPRPFAVFLCVEAGEVSFDFHDTDAEVQGQHYAFLVSEAEFDEVFGRVEALGVPYYADPMLSRPGEINHDDGGRGVYWFDPDGHFLEIITRPYGSGA